MSYRVEKHTIDTMKTLGAIASLEAFSVVTVAPAHSELPASSSEAVTACLRCMVSWDGVVNVTAYLHMAASSICRL
jgi:hypothetical protein